MRADERQAAVAYTYAWWLTGDDDAATDAVRTAIMVPGPPEGTSAEVALARGVRAHVGAAASMPSSSEMTLLHDGLDIDLQAAAEIAGVAPDDVPAGLAHGRLEALLETVREPFEHPERLGGLAVGDQDDMTHARQCPSCARARTLLERGRTELREVVSVSAPVGLLATLVADAAATEPAEGPAALEERPDDVDAAAPVAADEEIVLDEPVVDTDTEAAVATSETIDVEERPDEGAADVDTAVPDEVAVEDRPGVEQDDVVNLTEAPERPRPVTTKGQKRTAGILAGAGIVTVSLLVAVFIGSSGTEDAGTPADPASPAPTENPAMEEPTAEPSQRPDDEGPDEQGPDQGPPAGSASDFRVVQTGVLLPGEEVPAASGAEVSPDDLIRIAVDYEGATDGVQITAIWRVDEEEFDRLDALVSGRSSRHVWGVTPPEGGWPAGQHRIVLTADDGVAGAVDFTVSDS